ncbi:transposase domain-containing protein [Desulfosarcina widdelii]|nr:transposase domain-containing protein [Desulfosarcina widdelii]
MELAREYFKPSELAGKPGMPKTSRAVRLRCNRENWTTRPHCGRGGGREVHFSSLPEKTQNYIFLKARSTPVEGRVINPVEKAVAESENRKQAEIDALWSQYERKPEKDTLPSLSTFKRKLRREIPRRVLILAREGVEALSRSYPAQERDRGVFHALEAVNADGHKFDVFVRFPDGEVCRPVIVAFQDLYSGKILSYRVAKTENADTIRLAFGDILERYGIPEHAYLDNGRGFASKWMTGGLPNRYRFKIKSEDPAGIMPQVGTVVHWCIPGHGQSKPIERYFLDGRNDIAKHPICSGAYTGNSPHAKPENYGSKAVPLDVFMKVLHQGIIEHNARRGRRSKVCDGGSFDEVFAESYSQSPIRKATTQQRRLWLLAAEGVTASRTDGSITFLNNRYHCDALSEHMGAKLVARFDPDNLHDPIHVETLDGRFIGEADCIQAAGFNDTQAAREYNRKRNQYKKAVKKQLEAQRSMNAIEAANLLPDIDPPETPVSTVIEPMFKQAVGSDISPEERDELWERGWDKTLKNALRQ